MLKVLCIGSEVSAFSAIVDVISRLNKYPQKMSTHDRELPKI